MSRLVPRPPQGLDDDARALHDSIAGGPRAAGPQHFALVAEDGSLTGPFEAMLLSPPVGRALSELGSAIRYRTALSGRERELAILLVAHHHRSAFEVAAHTAVGSAAGLTGAELEALAGGADPALDDDREAAVHDAVRALLLRGDLSDAEYAAAVERLGEAGVFELSTLVGYYALLALQLRVFRVGA